MYELHTERLLPRKLFVRRLVRHGVLAGAVLLASLAIGTMGFHWLAPQEWLDAFLNSAMLLAGMVPAGEITLPAAELFAGLFALYAGIVFLGVATLFLAPVLHRILHKMRLDEGRKSA